MEKGAAPPAHAQARLHIDRVAAVLRARTVLLAVRTAPVGACRLLSTVDNARSLVIIFSSYLHHCLRLHKPGAIGAPEGRPPYRRTMAERRSGRGVLVHCSLMSIK